MAPEDAAQFVTHPTVQLLKGSLALTELEVTRPAAQYRVNPLDDARHLAALRSAQQVSKPVAQAAQAHQSYSQSRLLMPAHPVTQVIAPPGSGYPALVPIQRQFKALVQKPLHTGHHSLASTATAHINVRIIGIAHEAMTPSFQFAIEFVEQDVRQQRRESAGNNRANYSRIKWGLRIARESFAPRYAGCPDVEIILVIEVIAPTDGRLQS